MVMDWQMMPISWQGMDTKTDEKQVIPGKLTLLKNMWMDKTGIIRKRNGFEYITQDIEISTDFIGSKFGEALLFGKNRSSVLGADERLVNSTTRVYLEKSRTMVQTESTVNTVFGLSNSASDLKVMYFQSGTVLYAYLLDKDTLANYEARITVTAVGNVVDFCAFNTPGDDCACAFVDGGGLKLAFITDGASQTIVTVDAAVTGARLRAYAATVGGVPTVYILAYTGGVGIKLYARNALTGVQVAAPVLVTAVTVESMDVSVSDSGVIHTVVWDDSAADPVLQHDTWNAALVNQSSTKSASTEFAGLASSVLGDILILPVPSNYAPAAYSAWIFWRFDITGAELGKCGVWRHLSVVVNDLWVFATSARFCSRAFWADMFGEVPCVFMSQDNAEGAIAIVCPMGNSTKFPFTIGSFYFGKLQYLQPANTIANPFVNYYRSQVTYSAGAYEFIHTEYIIGQVEGGTTYLRRGARYSKFSVSRDLTTKIQMNAIQAVEGVLSNIYGDLTLFDGAQFSKPGFHSRPRLPVNQAVTPAGAGLAAGTYLYCLIWEWVDADGNLNRSAPSDILSVTVAAGPATVTLRCFHQSLNYHPKFRVYGGAFGYVAGATLVVYRTVDGGSIFYRVNSSLFSSATATYTDIVDSVTDSSCETSTPLYTTGGILEHIPAPATRSISVGKTRALVVSAESDELWVSKAFVPGEQPAFNEALVTQLTQSIGTPQVAIEMDDKIVIMHDSGISVLLGDGPDETGGGGFAGPQIVATEFGTLNANASVLCDEGVMFKSSRGIWLLSRSLELQYLGKEVDAYNAQTAVAAHNLRDRDQSWFWTSAGYALVFDAFHRIWSVFSFAGTVSHAATVSGEVYVASLNGTRTYGNFKESAGYDDDGTPIEVEVTSGWLSLAQLQGFQRIRRITFLGKSYAAHTVTLKLYYDYSSTVAETITISSATALPVGDSLYEYQVRPTRQKCTAFRFDLTCSDSTRAFELSGFALEVGVKGKTNRLPAYKRFKG